MNRCPLCRAVDHTGPCYADERKRKPPMKFCVDCVHCDKIGLEYFCKESYGRTDLVTGLPAYPTCRERRRHFTEDKCGSDGKLFVSKPKEPKTDPIASVICRHSADQNGTSSSSGPAGNPAVGAEAGADLGGAD